MKSVNKIAALNIFSIVLLEGISFFTLPIFTRMLGASQYGVYSVFNSWVSVLMCVMGLGISNALGVGRYQFKENYYEFRNSILLFGSLISLTIITVSIFFANPISDILGYRPPVVILMFCLSFSYFIVDFGKSNYTYEKKAEMNFFISITLLVTSVGLSLYLIPRLAEENKYLGRVYGTLIPYAVMALFLGIIMLKRPIRMHMSYCKFALSVGGPVVFHSLAGKVLAQSDQVMMQFMDIADAQIGIYSFYYTFGGALTTILDALNLSWCPFYFDDLDNEDWGGLKVKCKNYIELFSVLAIGFLLLSREVCYLLAGSEYWEGVGIIPIIVSAIYFTFMYKFCVNFEFFHKKTGFIAAGTSAAAIINIGLNAIMIPNWGIYGAAIATLLSHGFMFLFHYIIVTHMKKHPYHLKMIAFLPGIAAIFLGVIMFYALKEVFYVRWVLALLIGLCEGGKILKRKSIF